MNTCLHRHYEWVLFSFGYHGWAVGIILARLWVCNLLETSEEYFFHLSKLLGCWLSKVLCCETWNLDLMPVVGRYGQRVWVMELAIEMP